MSTVAVPAAGADPFVLSRTCRCFSEQSPQPMVALEGATHVVCYLNPAFARLVGKSPAELMGHTLMEAVPEGAGNGCLALLDRVFHTGTPENLAEQEHRQSRPMPSYWSYAVWAALGADGRPAGVIVHVTDATETVNFRAQAAAMNEALLVSSVRQHELIETIQRGERERHELERQMFQAQKLESLGVLAGGIAHDLNNLLTPVVGFAELASATLPAGSPAGPMLETVGANARRAGDLVQQILAYAGKGQFVIEPVELSALVREMRGLLGAAVSGNAELAYDLAQELPPVEADATQLRQVVMNLVTNASEAVARRGGTVTVRTGLAPADEPASAVPPKAGRPTGPAVFLEVEDSGDGMTADVIEKIFDPFFTTKFVGRGLGLAVVQGIARGHGGSLQVRSEPGRGSTFRFLIPSSPESAAVATVVLRPAAAWRGTGTVLVIDDDAGVRDIAARILEGAGLTVLVSGDGQEGVSAFHAHKERIGAVVLDLSMPGMGGIEVAGVLRGLRPDLPVVLMSGYSVHEVTLQSAGHGIAGFLQKPFNAPDLLAVVRHALGR